MIVLRLVFGCWLELWVLPSQPQHVVVVAILGVAVVLPWNKQWALHHSLWVLKRKTMIVAIQFQQMVWHGQKEH